MNIGSYVLTTGKQKGQLYSISCLLTNMHSGVGTYHFGHDMSPAGLGL